MVKFSETLSALTTKACHGLSPVTVTGTVESPRDGRRLVISLAAESPPIILQPGDVTQQLGDVTERLERRQNSTDAESAVRPLSC
ncbi:unnamed protein product [Rangifer tarandus platyrhynchus]|uniref:Uncharacterized protein n=1 Tax=Rangifer tarandus platyrhynchus TaxID=3082113 RepID=A0AC59ZW17_RANTA